MCGIAGYISKEKNRAVEESIVAKMLVALELRGPDEKVEYHPNSHIQLGYTRFAITDFQHGHQPFFDETKSSASFFNGEIYNWKELKNWLIRRGHKLKNNCDGEVLPHMYEEYGLDFITKLEGMYAVAIVDLKNHKILLTRDRVGEKPLYYSINPEQFLYGSTIPSLLASKIVSKEIDLQSIAEFFTFRYVPHTNTILKLVKKVESGTIVIFDFETWTQSTKIYWKPQIIQPQIISEEKAIEDLQALLFNSVKLRTETDRSLKIGSSLSGGIDSSTVTALSKKFLKNRTFHSFSVHVKDDPEDLTSIKKVVKKVNTKHHWIDCNREDVSLLPLIVDLMGEPISAGMTIPSYQCYKEARNSNVRVLLSGDGSDELFAGYSGRLIMDGIIKKWDTLDSHTRSAYLHDRPTLAEKLKSKLGDPNLSVLERYVTWDDDNCFNLDIRQKLLQGTPLANYDPLVRVRELEKLTVGASHENAVLLLELKLRLEGFMIVILDRTSMSCPVECRSPYLDSKIVDFAFRVAPELKYSHGIEKYILRKVMEKTGFLPKEILWRKKHPFSGPISTWIDYLPSNLESLLTPKVLDRYGFVNSKFVSQMYKIFKSVELDRKTRTYYSDILFAVLVITLWLEIFLQNRSAEELSEIKI